MVAPPNESLKQRNENPAAGLASGGVLFIARCYSAAIRGAAEAVSK